MNNFGYLLIKNEKVIGVFDNEEIIDTFINGGIQNEFFNKKSIKKLKFTMNSIYCHNNKFNSITVKNDEQTSNLDGEKQKEVTNKDLEETKTEIEEKKTEIEEKKTEIEEKKKEIEEKIKRKKDLEEKTKELLKDEEYQKIMQEKIDTKHEINELKQKKKKYEEAKNTYDCDIKLYATFQKEIEKNDQFVIPEIFSLKYELFEKLEKSNRLTFDAFYGEWEVIKPKNNYSMFGSNPYEDSFVTKNTPEDINIEMDI